MSSTKFPVAVKKTLLQPFHRSNEEHGPLVTNLCNQQDMVHKNGVYRLKLMKLKCQIIGDGPVPRYRNYSPFEERGRMNYPVVEKKKSFQTLFVDQPLPRQKHSPLKLRPLQDSRQDYNSSSIVLEESPANLEKIKKALEKFTDGEHESGQSGKLNGGEQGYSQVQSLVKELRSRSENAVNSFIKRYSSVDIKNEPLPPPLIDRESPQLIYTKRSLVKGQSIPRFQDFYLLRENAKFGYKPDSYKSVLKEDPVKMSDSPSGLPPLKMKHHQTGFRRMYNHEVRAIIEKEIQEKMSLLGESSQQTPMERSRVAPQRLRKSHPVEPKNNLSKEGGRPMLGIDCVAAKLQKISTGSSHVMTEELGDKQVKKSDKREDEQKEKEKEVEKSNRKNKVERVTNTEPQNQTPVTILETQPEDKDEIKEDKRLSVSPPRRILVSYKDRKGKNDVYPKDENSKDDILYHMIAENNRNEKSGIYNSDDSIEPWGCLIQD